MTRDEDRPVDRPSGGGPDALASLVEQHVLDAELAALVWLLVEANVPAVVASTSASTSDRVRASLIDLVRPDATLVRLAGPEEQFEWMPEASALGWRAEQPGAGLRLPKTSPAGTTHRGRTVMVTDLDSGGAEPAPAEAAPAGSAGAGPMTWGEHARVVIRALAIGYGMLATTRASRLEDVLSRLATRPVGAMDDELTRLGLVLILAPDDDGVTRVIAAHYLRPVSRDPEGHIHRFAPAVLATWDPRSGRFEHFAWAITDELAGRIGMGMADLEREQARRADLLLQIAGEPG